MKTKLSLLLSLLGLLMIAGCAGGEMSPPEESAIEMTQPAAGEAPQYTPTQRLDPTPAVTVAGPMIQQPAIPERRLLILEWPARVKVGDSDLVRVTLEVDEMGNITPTVEVPGNEVRGDTVMIPNLYETHTILAEARLDVSGIEFTPKGEISEPLQPGHAVTYYWSVQPRRVGTYRGAVWLHLRLIPFEDPSEENRMPLSVQMIEIEAVNFLGMGGAAARLLGGVGTVLGSLLGLDNLLSWFWRLIRRRPTNRNIDTS